MNIERQVGGSSGVSEKVSRVDMDSGPLKMGVYVVEVAEAATEVAARYYTQFEGSEGESEKVEPDERVVMSAGPLVVGTYAATVVKVALAARYSSLISEVRVVGKYGGYLNLMFEEICLVVLSRGMTAFTESRRSSIWNWMIISGL